MFFLDTDSLTHMHLGQKQIIDRIQKAGEHNIATTVVTAVEILRGRHAFLLKAADGTQLLRAQQLLDESESMLLDVKIVPIDSKASVQFDKLRQNKKLKPMGRADLLIACIGLAHQAVLVTRNVRHFQLVPGLRIENWIDG